MAASKTRQFYKTSEIIWKSLNLLWSYVLILCSLLLREWPSQPLETFSWGKSDVIVQTIAKCELGLSQLNKTALTLELQITRKKFLKNFFFDEVDFFFGGWESRKKVSVWKRRRSVSEFFLVRKISPPGGQKSFGFHIFAQNNKKQGN